MQGLKIGQKIGPQVDQDHILCGLSCRAEADGVAEVDGEVEAVMAVMADTAANWDNSVEGDMVPAMVVGAVTRLYAGLSTKMELNSLTGSVLISTQPAGPLMNWMRSGTEYGRMAQILLLENTYVRLVKYSYVSLIYHLIQLL